MQRPFDIDQFLIAALAEDIGAGDLTSNAVIPAHVKSRLVMRAREPMVLAGATFLPALFRLVDPAVRVTLNAEDGAALQEGDVIAVLEVRGGRLGELGVKEGDTVRHPWFSR